MLATLRICGVIVMLSYAAATALSQASGLSNEIVVPAYYGICVITTLASALVLLRVRQFPDAIEESHTKAALVVALTSALLCALALPTTSRDFWYYLAIGRSAVSGTNVLTETLSDASMAGLPLQQGIYRSLIVNYGPFWVWISMLLSSLTQGHLRWEFFAYKGVLLAGWLATIALLYRSLRGSPARQLQAIVVLGWLPLALGQILINGHNDIVMVMLLTTWLVQPRAATSWLLVGSALVKYVTAPLVALAAVDAFAHRSLRAGVALAVAVATGTAVIAWYWQDGALLAAYRTNQQFQLFTPFALIEWAEHTGWMSDGSATILVVLWRATLIGCIGWYGARYVHAPSRASLNAWVTTVLLAVILGASSIYPWYLIWILPGLLLASDDRLAATAMPFIVLLPFLDLLRQYGSMTTGRLTILLYAGCLIWWAAQGANWGLRTLTSRTRTVGPPID